ncbi:hypothetical protein FDF74_11280 [Clostridium niameyense]|uniref:Uncharacterized protein n=1 Tax=Clostridium niameyense TaxID=1622073 RepID=A0A6M0RC53_9CLOT|nr:hypothetical protein [Clostridium niameyense]NEZ47762.1 hypothetical protein [Clostridium niameyense]
MREKKEAHFGYLAKNKIVLIIAYPMITVENDDKIVLLANEYVSDRGKSKKLMKKNELYKHIVNI